MEWKAWTGWSQLTGEVVDKETIIETVRSLPAMDTLRILSMIDVTFESTDVVGQIEMKLLRLVQDGRFLRQPLIQDVLNRSTSLFHQHLRYALTQLVFKYADLDMDYPHDVPSIDVWEKVLSLILQLADSVRAQGTDLLSMKSHFIQVLQFASKENWSSQLLRTYEQYVHIGPTVTQDLDHGIGIDLDEIAKMTFGTQLRDVFANVFSLFSYLQQQYHARSHPDALATASYVGSAIMEQNPTLSRLMNQFSCSFTEFKNHMESYSFDELLWPTQHFKKKAFLRLSESVFMPLGLMFFAGRMGGGMYYSLIDNVPKEQRRQFQNYIGRMFEDWAISELRQVYLASNRIEIFERSHSNSENRKLPEAVSVYPEGNIVWECKTKRLTATVYESGNLATYESDMMQGIGKGILQTYDVAQQIADGLLLAGKVVDDTCLPVVVTLEPYPLYGFLRDDVAMMHQSNRPGNALSPLVISSFDFYLMCDFSITRGLNIWTVLIEWSKREAVSSIPMSLHEFLISQYGRPQLNNKYEQFIKELLDSTKNLYGLSN
ncbi:hypothetical protein [Alicyclobacillus fodiniaquatilis]|uniref:Uncharacterized protein n=1 Tax=Alicyclobacillus fodiniaquatilis TaxID=1661150 RepID=A0ABW4JGN9_9BACL